MSFFYHLSFSVPAMDILKETFEGASASFLAAMLEAAGGDVASCAAELADGRMPGEFKVPFSPAAQRNACKATTSWKQLSEWAADILQEKVTEDSLFEGLQFLRLLKHIYPGKILCCVVLDFRRDNSVTVPLVTSLACVTGMVAESQINSVLPKMKVLQGILKKHGVDWACEHLYSFDTYCSSCSFPQVRGGVGDASQQAALLRAACRPVSF